METNTYLLKKRPGRIVKCRTKSRRFSSFSATIVIFNTAEKIGNSVVYLKLPRVLNFVLRLSQHTFFLIRMLVKNTCHSRKFKNNISGFFWCYKYKHLMWWEGVYLGETQESLLQFNKKCWFPCLFDDRSGLFINKRRFVLFPTVKPWFVLCSCQRGLKSFLFRF